MCASFTQRQDGYPRIVLRSIWMIDFYSRGAWNSRIHVYPVENKLTMILKNYQHYSYFSIQVWRHFTHVYLSIALSCFTPACSPCEVRIVL